MHLKEVADDPFAKVQFADNPGSRRQPMMEYDKVVSILKAHCLEFLKLYDEPKLYRGMRGADPFVYINPQLSKRGSSFEKMSMEANIPWIWATNDPSWKEYPNRANSVMMTTNPGYAKNFGSSRVYIVIPYDNAKFGVTPTRDFNIDSFSHISRVLRTVSQRTFSSHLDELFRDFIGVYIREANLEYSDLISYLEQAQEKILDNEDTIMDEDSFEKFPQITFKYIQAHNNSDMSLVEFVRRLLLPTANKFTLKNAAGLKQISTNREVWTDSPCIMIEPNIVNYEDIREDVLRTA